MLKKGKECVSDLAREYEKANEAGINIEAAQRVLREEDKHDKDLYREKVKQKHKDERRKLKQERKKAAETSQSESEDDYEPDLSWLPDNLMREESDQHTDSQSQSHSDDGETENEREPETKPKYV